MTTITAADLNVRHRTRLRRFVQVSAQLGEMLRSVYEQARELEADMVDVRRRLARATQDLERRRMHGLGESENVLEKRRAALQAELRELNEGLSRLRSDTATLDGDIAPTRRLCERVLRDLALDERLRPLGVLQ